MRLDVHAGECLRLGAECQCHHALLPVYALNEDHVRSIVKVNKVDMQRIQTGG